MSQQTIIKCDGCGKVKGEVNKWFKINYGFEEKKTKDLCGEGCLFSELAKFLISNESFIGVHKC